MEGIRSNSPLHRMVRQARKGHRALTLLPWAEAGYSFQQNVGIAIGYQACLTAQPNISIAINATSNPLNPDNTCPYQWI